MTPVANSGTLDWVISVSYADNDNVYYRCNGKIKTSAMSSGPYVNYLPPLYINDGYIIENTQFAVADVIIYNTRLNDTQINNIQSSLSTLYGIQLNGQ